MPVSAVPSPAAEATLESARPALEDTPSSSGFRGRLKVLLTMLMRFTLGSSSSFCGVARPPKFSRFDSLAGIDQHGDHQSHVSIHLMAIVLIDCGNYGKIEQGIVGVGMHTQGLLKPSRPIQRPFAHGQHVCRRVRLHRQEICSVRAHSSRRNLRESGTVPSQIVWSFSQPSIEQCFPAGFQTGRESNTGQSSTSQGIIITINHHDWSSSLFCT